MFEKINKIFTDKKENQIEEEKYWKNYFNNLTSQDALEINDEKNEYDFPITKSQAITIANLDNNLKTDFVRNSSYKRVTWLSFDKYHIDLVEYEKRKYWNLQVTNADISFVEPARGGGCLCDGYVVPNELPKLNCLIDVENGEYIYSPKKMMNC